MYSNLDLYKFSVKHKLTGKCQIPYYKIDHVNQFDMMNNGFVCIDEIFWCNCQKMSRMWTILNSRTSLSHRNRIINNIILKSRKRNLNYTQSIGNDKLKEICYANNGAG